MSESFKDFGLKPFLMEALTELNFKTPMPVQEKLIPVIKEGKSVVGQSQTGSGKTHAFLLPIFDKIDPAKHEVQAVITTPSRELAYQIYGDAKQLAKHSPAAIKVGNYVGGTDKKRQIDKLQREQPEIVIGTPGRVLDLIQSNALDIHTATQFVVDEADMTLDLGFLEQVDKIAGRMPEKLQMMVFSATIPDKLRPFLRKYMDNPVVEEIPVKSVISPTIDNWLLSTKGRSKNDLIYKLLTLGEPYLALVFANTKKRVVEIANFLKSQGLKVAVIHGDLPARERKRVMREVQNLDFQFVVATDLAARGIDIDGVSHVINDGIPEDLDYFIHRVGRTGRKGMQGTAITLYSPDDEDQIEALEDMGIEFKPKELKNGEIVDSFDRNRRKKRGKKPVKISGSMAGAIHKAKKKVKPGYKQRIKKAINREQQQEHRIEIRQKQRQAKKRKKASSERYK
ncbi:DEAD/DEAH box helicase [Secundilactobacillus collinoides]|uniref:DEAD-box ATP-dependent RNA helicase CshB n=2 Tax=Secundilactobacillus collinoides TaxID=33960 RepID=A0A0R2B5B1_SECCO|nr:DEAD/DEAH box helicase [Secundilactobacillus collinoides]KRM74654.1 superfamily II DNA RNA helicase [Secundilactobacillus collinoides DSM 20515 = JCM 1123]KZL41480.1 DEAD/DEAH box helicase [Secundilactobacillus collinoides]